jgi:hypothetical protein
MKVSVMVIEFQPLLMPYSTAKSISCRDRASLFELEIQQTNMSICLQKLIMPYTVCPISHTPHRLVSSFETNDGF